mgnify:CR=1 FL=1
MYLTLVELKTRDGLRLPGLLYEPEHKATKKVVIFLHGNGSSSAFYHVKYNNTAADVFNRAGISYFAFNNRGAHYIQKLTRKTRGKEKEKVDYDFFERVGMRLDLDINKILGKPFFKNKATRDYWVSKGGNMGPEGWVTIATAVEELYSQCDFFNI